MKKRNNNIILGIMLMLLAADTAMATPVVDLGPGPVSGTPCGQVVIPMTLTNDPLVQVAGVSMDIGYNSTYLTPVNVTIGPAAQAANKTGVIKNIVSPGLYRAAVYSPTNDLTPIGNGIVAYVTFGIECDTPAATYQLSNSSYVSTPAGVDIPDTGTNASIQVSAASTTTTVGRAAVKHYETCVVCHSIADVHTPATHSADCSVCHYNNITTNIPEPQNCIVCHPTGNIGTCNLTNLHDPSKSTSCMVCHADCNAVTTDDHIKQCLTCHPATPYSSTATYRIHSRPGHGVCADCHAGGITTQDTVTADKCSVCHPLSSPDNVDDPLNPNKCKIVDLHSPNIISSCLNCHMSCAGGGPISSTTTTASGSTTSIPGGTTTTSTPVTTTIAPKEHFNNCQICHYETDLHADSGHNVCSTCHKGTPGLGNVTASECIVCHPTGAPGQCNLVAYHGKTCTVCHTESICTPPTTTTSVSSGSHTDLCIKCHYVSDIHSHPQHSDCSSCHSGTPASDNVSPNSCLACHGPKCTLVNFHGNTCTTCHASCIGGTTSTSSTTTTANGTSTTTVPPGTCQILSVAPVNGVNLGFGFLPRIAKITVSTNIDLKSIGIIDCDLKFENNPRGIHVLGGKVIGSSVEATVLFVAVKPGTYTILLGDCGSTSIKLTRFWTAL